MLNATVQKLGDATILHFKGRIVIGDACLILRNAVLGQAHRRMLVLDLAQVDRIDAGGLGVLLGLREWARSNAIMFKLMNAGNKVEQVLELTRLDRVFESCSVRDLFCLLRRAAAMPPWSVDESNPADAEATCNPSVLGQESVPACERGIVFSSKLTSGASPGCARITGNSYLIFVMEGLPTIRTQGCKLSDVIRAERSFTLIPSASWRGLGLNVYGGGPCGGDPS